MILSTLFVRPGKQVHRRGGRPASRQDDPAREAVRPEGEAVTCAECGRARADGGFFPVGRFPGSLG